MTELDRLDTEEYTDLLQRAKELIHSEYKKEGTIDGYSKRFRYFLSWCDDRDDVDPYNISEDDLKNYIRYLKGNQSPHSISARVVALSSTYDILIQENIAESNPAKGFNTEGELNFGLTNQRTIAENRQGPNTNYDTITPEEFELMLKHVPNPRTRNELMLKMMWSLMIRAREVTTIELQHIHQDDNKIQIKDTKKNVSDKDQWFDAYYKDDLTYLLNRWINSERHNLCKHAWPQNHEKANDEQYLFVTDQQAKMDPSHVSRIVKRSANRADKALGIEPEAEKGIQRKIATDASGKRSRWKVTAHTLRRSAATHLANKTDYPLHMLADDLNHRSVDTTREKYIREDKEERKRRRKNIEIL